MSAHDQLLVVIDPVARRSDGESVRIAKDVLCGGSEAKICLPEGPEEFARALARRGARRPVVVGDDRALLRAVSLLHRDRWLGDGALSLIPVGPAVDLAHSLGVPRSAVSAARAVLDGVVRRLDLLVDESDGVVVGDLAIPASAGASGAPGFPGGPGSGGSAGGAGAVGADGRFGASGAVGGAGAVWGACRSLVRTLVGPAGPAPVPLPAGRRPRLRVEADGVLLADLDHDIETVTVRTAGGRAEVVVRPGGSGEPLTAKALTVTVSGTDFRYRADTLITGPVRTRTWTLRVGAWGLTLPS